MNSVLFPLVQVLTSEMSSKKFFVMFSTLSRFVDEFFLLLISHKFIFFSVQNEKKNAETFEIRSSSVVMKAIL